MNRRDFIQLLLATPIAAQLDIEKMLWIPKPMIVVPEQKIQIFGNLWLEDWGKSVCSYIDGRKVYRTIYEVDKMLEKLYRNTYEQLH